MERVDGGATGQPLINRKWFIRAYSLERARVISKLHPFSRSPFAFQTLYTLSPLLHIQPCFSNVIFHLFLASTNSNYLSLSNPYATSPQGTRDAEATPSPRPPVNPFFTPQYSTYHHFLVLPHFLFPLRLLFVSRMSLRVEIFLCDACMKSAVFFSQRGGNDHLAAWL